MKAVLLALLCLLTMGTAFSQQIGTVDLTKPRTTKARQQQEKTTLPADCTQPTGGMANGAVVPDDKQQRPISLEIVKLSNEILDVGSEVRKRLKSRPPRMGTGKF